MFNQQHGQVDPVTGNTGQGTYNHEGRSVAPTSTAPGHHTGLGHHANVNDNSRSTGYDAVSSGPDGLGASGAGLATGHTAGNTGSGLAHTNYPEHHTTTHNNNNNIAPSSALHSSNNHSATATNPDTKKARTEEKIGKVEKVVGKAIHSHSLQVKGEAKLEHAHAVQAQSAELTEAERLEAEARLRRERADQHGATAGLGSNQGANHGGIAQSGVGGSGGRSGF